MAMLALREGLGSGIIVDGKLHRGAHFAAGEVGYLLSGQAALAQQSVSFGSLEAALWQLLHVDRHPRSVTAAAAPRSGAGQRLPLSTEATQAVADYLALACIAVAAILDVQRIVLGGDVAVLSERVVTRVADQLRAHVPHPPDVVLSKLGDLAAIRGAGLALQQELGPELGALLR
jgi:predicted NBD/HSP70 family sugar kinase